MYWADQLADEIIRRKPNKEEYVCAAGISPSGSVHIGNFRDIATSYFVYRALLRRGKKARHAVRPPAPPHGKNRFFPRRSHDPSYPSYLSPFPLRFGRYYYIIGLFSDGINGGGLI